MHIVKFAFESAGFDVRLMRGGLASLVWNLAREFVDQGHRVSVVTPAHGCLDHLMAHYDLEDLDHLDEHTLPLVLDPRVWPDRPAQLSVPLRTRAYRLRHEGVDIYFLSDDFLDLLPERIYPAATSEGIDLSFFKPLAFQVAGIRFIRDWMGDGPLLLQAYEPYYHYLLPLVFRDAPQQVVVSTVASNMPINQKVYRPQLERLLELFQVTVDLDAYDDPESSGALASAMADHLPSTHLGRRYGPDYICFFALIAANCDLIDFLTPGQLDFYSAFRDTPFERAFESLTVSRVVRATAARQFVGGCAIPTQWLARDPASVDRKVVLGERGLDPTLPTFYHVARFSVHHKGQVELFRAIDAVLAVDPDVNFVLRCAMGAGGEGAVSRVGDPYFQEVADRYPDRVQLEWTMVDEDVLFEEAASADFCLFPSKFELDSFLIAQGQLMACGAVPIGTAQEVTSHYRHHLPRTDAAATGFAVPRSFTEDDPLLVGALVDRIHEAVRVYREGPAEYRRLSANSRELASEFTWEQAARTRLDRFAQWLAGGRTELAPARAIAYGWFNRLSENDWVTHRQEIERAAIDRGDLATYLRCGPVDRAVLRRMFAAAYRRADFPRCEQLADLLDDHESTGAVRERCRIEQSDGGWAIRYRMPYLEGVSLLLPDGLGGHRTHRLAGRAGSFSVWLPEAPEVERLVFLLQLDTGRTAWDDLSVDACLAATPAIAGRGRG